MCASSSNYKVNLGLIVGNWTHVFCCGTMSHAMSSLHWSDIHYQVTFEWHSGRGSETSIVLKLPLWFVNIWPFNYLPASGNLLSADRRQIENRSGPTFCRSWSGSKLFDPLMLFLIDIFERVHFEKYSADWACKISQHAVKGQKCISVTVNYSWPVFVAVVQFIVPIFVQLIVNDCFIDTLNRLFPCKKTRLALTLLASGVCW